MRHTWTLYVMLGLGFLALLLGVNALFDLQRAFLEHEPMSEPLVRSGVFLIIAILSVIAAAEVFLFFLGKGKPGKWSAEEYRDAFLGRFYALVQAQDLGFTDQEEETGLAALIERSVTPYTANPEAVVIAPGAALVLSPRTISSLAIVLHELATNAAKYGALSLVTGRVRVSWQVEKETSTLWVRWVESGGPRVTPPATTGYGTKLIESATTYSLGGQVEQKYAVGGLETEIAIPLGSASLPIERGYG